VNLRKHKPGDKTIISTSESTTNMQRSIYVEAQTSEKALDLWRKLKECK
jgi:hypothetical protein